MSSSTRSGCSERENLNASLAVWASPTTSNPGTRSTYERWIEAVIASSSTMSVLIM